MFSKVRTSNFSKPVKFSLAPMWTEQFITLVTSSCLSWEPMTGRHSLLNCGGIM